MIREGCCKHGRTLQVHVFRADIAPGKVKPAITLCGEACDTWTRIVDGAFDAPPPHHRRCGVCENRRATLVLKGGKATGNP